MHQTPGYNAGDALFYPSGMLQQVSESLCTYTPFAKPEMPQWLL